VKHLAAIAVAFFLAPVSANRCLASENLAVGAGSAEQPQGGPVKVTGVIYTKRGTYGDFGWMRLQSEFDDAFFVFNDNFEQFSQHLQQPSSSTGEGCEAGGGNATIRPWQCEMPPRAGGIPTGIKGGGYTSLTAEVKNTIDHAIEAIKSSVDRFHFKRIFYSSCRKNVDQNCTLDDDLGTSIYQPSESVRAYIVNRLKSLDATP